jgi:hypothetical protein
MIIAKPSETLLYITPNAAQLIERAERRVSQTVSDPRINSWACV